MTSFEFLHCLTLLSHDHKSELELILNKANSAALVVAMYCGKVSAGIWAQARVRLVTRAWCRNSYCSWNEHDHYMRICINLKNGEPLNKHNLYGANRRLSLIEASINIIKRYHTNDMTPPSAWAELFFSNVNRIQSMIPEDKENITTQWRANILQSPQI